MRYDSIRQHLQPYVIRARRTTTINHAFAAAVAPNDIYDPARVRDAIITLGQDPEKALECAYCGAPAETWDHLFSTVRASKFSGHGHRVGNLLPCCKQCNSRKGNKTWQSYLAQIDLGAKDLETRTKAILTFIEKFSVVDELPISSQLHRELDAVRREVLRLIEVADSIASQIRQSESAKMAENAPPNREA